VWCAITSIVVTRPFFRQKTINSNMYLDMLENYAFSQLEGLGNTTSIKLLQLHISVNIKRQSLNAQFPR
jgi:hypothetical protein